MFKQTLLTSAKVSKRVMSAGPESLICYWILITKSYGMGEGKTELNSQSTQLNNDYDLVTHSLSLIAPSDEAGLGF